MDAIDVFIPPRMAERNHLGWETVVFHWWERPKRQFDEEESQEKFKKR